MRKILDSFCYDNNITISGLTKELNSFYINELSKKYNNVVVVTNSLYDCNKYYQFLETLNDKTLIFPMDEFVSSVALVTSPELKSKRLETLKKITYNDSNLIVTNLMGFLKYLPNFSVSKRLSFNLKVNNIINRKNLIELLERFGYKKENIVTSTGEYAVRGYVIDFFAIDSNHPVRIELFDNEIESIRYFDENNQRKIQEINNIEVFPFEEIKTDNPSSLIDYLNNAIVVYIDYDQIINGYKKIQENIKELNEKKDYMYSLLDIIPNKKIFINEISNNKYTDVFFNYKSSSSKKYNNNFVEFSNDINKEISKGKTVLLYFPKIQEINLMDSINSDYVISSENNIVKNKINVIKNNIDEGFIINDYCVYSDKDLDSLVSEKSNYYNPYKIGKKIKNFSDISIGDFVVHYYHGIGIYQGVISLSKNGLAKDYIQINYAGNDKVYIPVEKIDTIYKYNNKEGSTPRINKLGTTAWENTKISLQRKIKDISKELLELYSLRAKAYKKPFVDYEEENIFSAAFEYQETIDQKNAIEEIFNDLRSTKPMDRLLCGDVGFGKTEVSFRAIYKAILNGYQVAYLCPTTILSKQQYDSAVNRFKDFGVNVAIFNRFTTTKEKKIILKQLKNGLIDIIIGTHRLLSKEIIFKNLGLLVVDEEQRFGVTHKERIKKMKDNVNVLTLSATPIPRTLKMALSGIRDLSIIDTAPVNRYPVQTYVIQESEMLIKDAIYKELSRNGQTFILFNQVSSIEERARYIGRLIPEAKVGFAHGQMNKTELEMIMEDFVQRKYDILVCTTIIETGIDIPNANTLIVYDSELFGLSQLYQLRGRVGRSNKIAYAYLLYNKNKILNSIAIKRLEAIKEFTELGSGYRIAARDLAIRGAGDLLGGEQAGFVASVGLDLYMKMIDNEINGISEEHEENDGSLIDVETHIDNNYISDEEVIIEVHKLINEVDSYKKMQEVKNELEDRFGKISEKIEIYMYEEWFEKIAKELKITKVSQTEKEIIIELPEDISSTIQVDKLFLLAYSINPKFTFKYISKKIQIKLNIYNIDKHFIYYIVDLLQKIQNL